MAAKSSNNLARQIIGLSHRWLDLKLNRPIEVTLLLLGSAVFIISTSRSWAVTAIELVINKLQIALGYSGESGELSWLDGIKGEMTSALGESLGALMVVSGIFLIVVRKLSESRQRKIRRVIVVEGRGLRDGVGTPLERSVPQRILGQRILVPIDLRQGVIDGKIVNPEAALRSLSSLPKLVKQHEAGVDRGCVTVVYGGLTPVPFTFLTGMLLDDEREIEVLDWNRHRERWQELNELDDGGRFEVIGLESGVGNTPTVALAVSVSYQVGMDAKIATGNQIPLIELRMPRVSSELHWSKEKQVALGCQFQEVVTRIKGMGVKRIHLFLAAPNSVVFRFGRLYDIRNFLNVVVWQYEGANSESPYKWGILMPCSDEETGSIWPPDGSLPFM